MFSDAALAVFAARAAGERLRHGRGQSGDAGDRAADEVLTTLLSKHRPDDAVLSEETGSRGQRAQNRRVWIVDPLDGSREYAEAGRTDWAVHVALWVDGDLREGAVAVPAREEVWSTVDPGSAADAQRAPAVVRRILVSRSRAPHWADAVADELGAELIPMGSAGAKVAALLRGEADAYLHDGGQYEWDSAAPVVVARHYGWSATRLSGSELRYNQPEPYLPDLLVGRPRAAELLRAAVARHRDLAPMPS